MSVYQCLKTEFLLLAQSGVLETQSLLLCESLRKFGGRYASADVTVLESRPECPISAGGRAMFEKLGAQVVKVPVVSPCPEYGTSYRVMACAAYETQVSDRLLIFLDSDSLILCEPDFALAGADVAARPVDVRGMCTTGANDRNDAYWRALCEVCGVDYESLPWTTTTVDQCRVRASYNGGLTVVRSGEGLFGRTADFFARSIRARLFTRHDEGVFFQAGHGEVRPEGSRLWGSAQACLSLAITALGLKVRMLPPGLNFPLHFYRELSGKFSGDPLVVSHAHYHHLLRDPEAGNPILDGSPGFPDESRAWLKTRLETMIDDIPSEPPPPETRLHWSQIPGWFQWRSGQEEAVAAFPDGSRFVEVGTFLGRGICSLAELVEMSGKELVVIGVDTCTGSGIEGPRAKDYHADAVREGGGTFAGQLHRNVLACGAEHCLSLVVSRSVAAAKLFPDHSFQWVHLDARHDYDSVKEDITAWLPKVVPGGWISGDDYIVEKWPGLVAAVSELLPGAEPWSVDQWRWKVPA